MKPARFAGVVAACFLCACLAAGEVPAPPAAKGRAMNAPQELSAGPLRLKFQDGELRYLYVGDREVVRRVYFAVRNKSWATAMPVFTESKVTQNPAGGFTIDLKADCRSVGADYSWTGRITGAPDGTITFRASGAAGTAFDSNRIGLCVLYGSPTVVGQKFETVNVAGETKPGAFPEFVSPKLVAPDYQTLRYATPDGLTVSVTGTGAKFDMEDQRTYGDSSFKAYAPLPYDYKAPIPAGDTKEQTVTISVTGAPARPSVPDDVTALRVGAPVPGAVVPKIVLGTETPGSIFGSVNGQAEKHRGATALTWGFNPSTHLPDDDTFFENVSVLVDQVRSAHSYAPGAAVTIDPVTLDQARAPAGESDPRPAGAFGAAWSVAVAKHLALAGVAEARFRIGAAGSPARQVQEELAKQAGRPVREVFASGGGHPTPVEALAVDTEAGTTVWIANRTAQPRRVRLDGAAERTLAPYEVIRVRP